MKKHPQIKTPGLMRRQSRQRGASLVTVMFFIGGISLVALSTIALSTMGSRMSYRSQGKVVADTLAESGLNHLYDAIRVQMATDETYPDTLSSTDLDAPSGETLGTYTARVINMTTATKDFGGGPETEYTFTIEGTGVAANGGRSIMQAQFTARGGQGQKSTETSGDQVGLFNFLPGAIQSNTTVKFNTEQGIRTYDETKDSVIDNAKFGHIVGNKGVIWEAPVKGKSAFTNPNIFDIQGKILAPAVPDKSIVELTISAAGMGNTQPLINYQTDMYALTDAQLRESAAMARLEKTALEATSQPVPTTVTNLATGLLPVRSNPGKKEKGEITALEREWYFPDQPQVDKWEGDWTARTHAPDSTQICSDLGPGECQRHPKKGYLYIVPPMVIHGNMNIPKGTTIRILPRSSNPVDNVVLVTGDVNLDGQLFNLGATVVVKGKFTAAKGSEYRLDKEYSPYEDSEAKLLINSNLVSLSDAPDAIDIRTDASSMWGLIYSARGGIRVNSSNIEVTGALVSGSPDPTDGIRIETQGSASFVVKYRAECLAAKEQFPLSKDTGSGSYSACEVFTPNRMTNYIRKR